MRINDINTIVWNFDNGFIPNKTKFVEVDSLLERLKGLISNRVEIDSVDIEFIIKELEKE